MGRGRRSGAAPVIAARLAPSDSQLDSPLGRASPLLKLAIALVWLIGLAVTLQPVPPLLLTAAAFAAGITIGNIRPRVLLQAAAPLWLAAIGIGTFNALFSGSNGDPTASELAAIGPVRLTVEAVAHGVALALRVVAIGCVGAVFALTTDPTRLADSLVQQARVPERFAYGALAAYGAIPRFGEDLATLRQARRIRGLGGSWHPRLLLGMLVLAIRHGDRMDVSMDARAFGSGPRTRYREIRWHELDLALGLGAGLTLVAALWLARAGAA
jgi:energy-coupling factor transport system permease protein